MDVSTDGGQARATAGELDFDLVVLDLNLPRHVLLEDMVHAGVLGLMDALHKFDGSKHVQFGSYAKFRIRGAILDRLQEMDWSPRDLRRKARDWKGRTVPWAPAWDAMPAKLN